MSNPLSKLFKTQFTNSPGQIISLFSLAIALMIVSIYSSSLYICLLSSLLVSITIHYLGQKMTWPKPWLIILSSLAIFIIFSNFWLSFLAEPANAQFFKKAEDFFQNNLSQGSNSNNNTQAPISLVFNILRAVYLLYIAGSLVSVINAVRKDEEWQSMARTPLMVVIAVTIADVLTGFIIGDNSK